MTRFFSFSSKCYPFSITELKPIESGEGPLKVGPMGGANGVGNYGSGNTPTYVHTMPAILASLVLEATFWWIAKDKTKLA